MSHLADIEMELNDLDALDKACQSLGLELVRGQKNYKWFGRSVGDYPLPVGMTTADLGKCEHAIRIPGNKQAYEIGVVPNKQGRGYRLLWDFWNGGYGMQAKVGSNGELLKQNYTAKLAAKTFRKKGFRVTETKNEKGQLIVRCKRG